MKPLGEKWLIYKTQLSQLQVYIVKIFATCPQYFSPFQVAKVLRDAQIDGGLPLTTGVIKDEIKSLREFEIDVFSFSNNFSSSFQVEVLLEMSDEGQLDKFYQDFIGPQLAMIRSWDLAEKRIYLRFFYLSGKNPDEMKKGVKFYSKTLIKPQCEGFSYTSKINPQFIENFWYELLADEFFTGPMEREYEQDFNEWLEQSSSLNQVYHLAKALKTQDFVRLRDLVNSWQGELGRELVDAFDHFFRANYREASRVFARFAKIKLDKWTQFPNAIDEIYLRCLSLSGLRGDRKSLDGRQLNNSHKKALMHVNEYRETGQLPPFKEITLQGSEITFYKALRLFMEKRKLSDSELENCVYLAEADREDVVLYREWLSLLSLANAKINEVQLQDLNKRLCFPSFASFIEVKEEWESGLEFIEKFFSNDEQKRVVWRFTLNEAGWDLRPFEQKRGRSAWLKGKQIAFDKLQHKSYLSELDKQILSNIVYQSGNYIEWTGNEVLELVSRHPLLFDSYDLDKAVSIEIEEGGVCLDESENFFILDLPDEYKRNVIIKRSGPYKYIYYRFPESLSEVQEKLGDEGLKIPKTQGARIRALLPQISQSMPVMSNWRDEAESKAHLSESHSDIRIVAEPMDEDEGVNFRLRVPVFGSGTPEFVPGEGPVVIWKDGKQCVRDIDAERKKLREALSLVDGLPVLEEDGFLALYDQQMALDFLMALHQQDFDIFWPKKAWSVKQSKGRLTVKIEKDADWFNLYGKAEFDGDALHFSELFANLSKEGSYVKLSDQRFIKLSQQLQEQIQVMQANLGEYHGALGFPKLRQSEMARALAGVEDKFLPQNWDADVSKLRKIFSRHFIFPKNFKAELRSYQEEGFQWLSRMAEWGAGACLADDMGLGKTVQALAVLSARAHLGPSLVVAPTSVCGNWQEEVQRFAPMLKVQIYDSTFAESAMESLDENDLLVCSYTMLQRDVELISKRQWNGIVLDEAQAIKNPQSGRSKAARSLESKFKIATTGTPVENHPGEIWALFDFLNPGYLGSQTSFGKEINSAGVSQAINGLGERLRRRVQPFILRRLKKDVLKDLPERTEINLRIPLSPDERGVYNGLRARASDRLGKRGGDRNDKFFILEEITRLRQAACSPSLLDKQFSDQSAKLKRFIELVKELKEAGHRALVFSQFTSFLDLVEKALAEEDVDFLRLDGSTPAKKRPQLVKKFQVGKSSVFLISLKAGGFGLNLTAANYVIHLDPWWNPAVEDQATDRAHRIGQEKAVTVYRLISEGTIEEKILKLHESKRELADFMLGNQNQSAKMSADELLRLLN
ncbi:swf/snf family helicase [Lentisphaera araneosa HTCC2155]|uniref:Swf/snf family helicase n=1 Tax=Lentisphaera araneosa HTCC2155 TaxID=313628 RepID=A6DMQ1_9BACT|nr:DEAD/DEAH box helicase [Lentisphaera araneosa]EDM27241.1 swf/snf family helicase [Lentisphaera araneosa HTCC2155]